MSRAPWIIATRNPGKLRELRALFADEDLDVIDLHEAGIPETADEDALEVFETFEENALAKAKYFSARLPGRDVVADDSGLEVTALGGEPGVRSKRWSGRGDLRGADLDRENNSLLVERLRGMVDRRARFVCAAGWSRDGQTLVVRGELPGTIVDVPSGEHGFGYDPYFRVDELGRTLADATVAEKQRVSHRGRAFGRLLQALRGTERG